MGLCRDHREQAKSCEIGLVKSNAVLLRTASNIPLILLPSNLRCSWSHYPEHLPPGRHLVPPTHWFVLNYKTGATLRHSYFHGGSRLASCTQVPLSTSKTRTHTAKENRCLPNNDAYGIRTPGLSNMCESYNSRQHNHTL